MITGCTLDFPGFGGVRWLTGVYNWKAPTTIVGEYAGDNVNVQFSAPWVPQS